MLTISVQSNDNIIIMLNRELEAANQRCPISHVSLMINNVRYISLHNSSQRIIYRIVVDDQNILCGILRNLFKNALYSPFFVEYRNYHKSFQCNFSQATAATHLTCMHDDFRLRQSASIYIPP